MAGEIIRMGDRTSHGGTVLEGCLTANYMGEPIALVGHQTRCPKCGGTYPIVEGVSTTTFLGKSVAVAGMKTACGAVLIASQFVGTVERTQGRAEGVADASESTTNAACQGSPQTQRTPRSNLAASAQEGQVEVEEFYSFTSGDGQPLNHYCYDLFVEGELHTRGAQYTAGQTNSFRSGASTHLVTWLNQDSAAKK